MCFPPPTPANFIIKHFTSLNVFKTFYRCFILVLNTYALEKCLQGFAIDSFKIWTFPFQSCTGGQTPWPTHLWDNGTIRTILEETGLAVYIVVFPDCAMGMTDRATFILIIIWAFHSKATATLIYYKDPPCPSILIKECSHAQVCVSIVAFHQPYYWQVFSESNSQRKNCL